MSHRRLASSLFEQEVTEGTELPPEQKEELIRFLTRERGRLVRKREKPASYGTMHPNSTAGVELVAHGQAVLGSDA
jgi:hypothetical protein